MEGAVVGLFALLMGACAVGSRDTGSAGHDDPIVAALKAVERGDSVTVNVAADIRRRHPELDDLAAFAAARATLANGDTPGARGCSAANCSSGSGRPEPLGSG